MWCVCVNKQNPPKNGIVLPSRFQGSEVALLGDEVFFGVFVVFPPSLFFQAGSLFTGGLMTGLWWMMRLKKEGRKEDYGGQLFFLMQLIKKMQALPRRDQAPKFHQGQVRFWFWVLLLLFLVGLLQVGWSGLWTRPYFPFFLCSFPHSSLPSPTM